MRYVQRNAAGEVIGHFANEQPYARETLDDAHPDIVAYKERVAQLINPPAAIRVAGTVRRSAYAYGLTEVLAARFGIPKEQLLAEIVAAARGSFSGELDG